MKVTFNFKTFIFILLLIFAVSLIISTNAYIYIFSKILITRDKQNEYEAIIETFQQYFEGNIKDNEIFLNSVRNIIERETNSKERKVQLQRLLELNPSVKYIIIFSKNGFIKKIYPERKDALNLYLGNSPIFLDIGKALFSGPHVFLIDRKSYYAQSLKFRDDYISILVDLPDFNSYLKGLNKKGYVSFVVDNKGKIIAHYEESFVNEGMNIKMLISDLYEIRETDTPKEFTIKDKKYLLYSKYIPPLDKYIFMGNEYRRAFAEYNIFKEQILWLVLFFIMIAFALSLVVSNFIQKPFFELFGLIDNIKKRNKNLSFTKTYFLEFNNLAENISDMGREIAEIEEKLVKLFETSRDAIIISDIKGQILEINPAGLQMFGYENKEQIESALAFYSKPSDRSRFIEQVMQKGYIENYEIKAKRKDGSYFYALLSSSLVRDERNEPLFFISVAKDITEKLRIQQQLFQAQKMESLGKLVGTIAHDLNNMLTVVSSNNQLIQIHTKEDEKIGKYTEGIAVAVGKIRDFIKQLLAFSKRQVFEFKIYDLNEVIQEEIKLLKPALREDVTLKVKTYSEPLYVSLDVTQFTQVLLNLLVNSLEAMPNGGEISISLERKRIEKIVADSYPRVKEGVFACVSFSDTGKGIPEEIIDKIFEPFFTTKESGTGLGLSTVYSIVEQHKGFINVYSELGKGTTFRIYLPLTDKEKETSLKIENKITVEKRRILLVEDNPEVRTAIEELLRKYGFEVHSFASGVELIEKFDYYIDRFDVCLSDIIMPRMNGLELYRKLKQTKPDIKFLFMTGYAENIEQINELTKEGLKVLSKPFSIDEFVQKIREIEL